MINGKIYIGAHKSDILNDDYLGSGKNISSAIKKYGKENFHKSIIAICENESEMFNLEKTIVNSSFIKRSDTYNIKEGGYGGWDHIDCSERNKRTNSNRNYLDENYRKKLSASMKKVMAKRMLNGEIPFKNCKCRGFSVGYKHSEETKKKISEKNKGKTSSTKGRLWIHNLNLKKAKMIFPNELEEYLNNGWLLGNKRNFTLGPEIGSMDAATFE